MDPTAENLIARARQLQAEAQTLLGEGKLLTPIQRVGPTCISGSVALNLMARRDVDIYVQLEHDLDISTFFEIGAAIAGQFPVLKASYSNHFIRNFPAFNHGLYWGIRLLYNGQPWKLDLWGHGPQHFSEHCAEFERLQRALQEIDPLIILRIKEAFRYQEGYLQTITGMDIYTAVLTADVRTSEQFQEWWNRRLPTDDGPTGGIET